MVALAERQTVAIGNFEANAFPACMIDVRCLDTPLAQPEPVSRARTSAKPLLEGFGDAPGGPGRI